MKQHKTLRHKTLRCYACSTVASLMGLTALLVATLASAQNTDDRSATFQRVEGPTEQDVSGFGLMVAAYLVMWAIVGLFAVRVSLLQRKTQQELNTLAQKNTGK